ncbi:hypothetical protein CMK18_15795 [Candidatus Poribacteria bacterium]|nr:hypothetical protein [Candidatus Poribacteria bacterium]
MQINISGRSYEFSDDIQHYIQKRAKKLSRHIPNSLSLSVTMKRQKNSYTALVNHTTKKKTSTLMQYQITRLVLLTKQWKKQSPRSDDIRDVKEIFSRIYDTKEIWVN